MLSELVTAGKHLWSGRKPTDERIPQGFLIQSLTAPQDATGQSSLNGTEPTHLFTQGQVVMERAITRLQPLRQQLVDVLEGVRHADVLQVVQHKQAELMAALLAVTKQNRDRQPARQQPAGVTILTDHNYKISKIALGLSVAAFAFPPLAIAALVLLVIGLPNFVRRTYTQFFNEQKATVDLLVLATFVVGLALGAGTLITGNAIFTFTLTLNLFLVNYSHRLMRQVREAAKETLIDVFRQQPTVVWALIDEVEMEVKLESLCAGDIVVVNAGETIPVDGRIVNGTALVDQHILTGEAQPAEKGAGDQVFALTLLAAGKLQIIVEKTGEETTAAQIGKVLNKTMNFKTGMQLWAEDIADKSVIPTLVASGVLLPFLPMVSWTLLVAHPKHRGIVATYVNILSYLDLTAKQGILLKDGRVLELLNQVDTVVFDKTGTLTETQPQVGQVHTWSRYTVDEVLTYAAAAEYRQTHPVAHAILQAAQTRSLVLPIIDEAAYKIGYGLTVLINEATVRVGSLRFLEEEGLTLPEVAQASKQAAHQQGHSLILVAVDETVVGAIELEPTVRPEAKAIIAGLRKRGIKATYIISGDHEAPTRKLAQELGIDHYFAETLPEGKANLIEQLQQEGKTVCYVGDGINDAIALKKAAVSISLQGASTVATDTAKVILMDKSLNKLCDLFDLAADFQRNMNQTFGLVMAPHLVSFFGFLFLNFGLLSVVLLCQLGLGIGVGNALLPRLLYQRQEAKKLPGTNL